MEESGFMKKANCYDSPGGANKVLDKEVIPQTLYEQIVCGLMVIEVELLYLLLLFLITYEVSLCRLENSYCLCILGASTVFVGIR